MIFETLNKGSENEPNTVSQSFIEYLNIIYIKTMSITSTGLYGASTNVNTDLFDDVEKLKIDVTNLTTSVSQNSYDIDQLETTTTDHETRIDTLESNNTDNKSRLDTLESNNTDNKSRLDTLETDKSRLDTLETDKSRLDTLETDNTDNKSRLDTLETDNTHSVGFPLAPLFNVSQIIYVSNYTATVSVYSANLGRTPLHEPMLLHKPLHIHIYIYSQYHFFKPDMVGIAVSKCMGTPSVSLGLRRNTKGVARSSRPGSLISPENPWPTAYLYIYILLDFDSLLSAGQALNCKRKANVSRDLVSHRILS
jgi:hypothetical protein